MGCVGCGYGLWVSASLPGSLAKGGQGGGQVSFDSVCGDETLSGMTHNDSFLD